MAETILKKQFFKATKGKIILVFLLACVALLLAWAISKFVFTEMLGKVAEISTPNERFRIVNELSHKITKLDQQQRKQLFNSSNGYTIFLSESRKLRLSLDTLIKLYQQDSIQSSRLKSIKNLLSERDKQFLMYLNVRETLVNTKSFSDEVNKLSGLFEDKAWQSDTTVLTTETKTSTTRVSPSEIEKSKGFLSRLFGRKKTEMNKIISEELKVKTDTLNLNAEDSIITNMENALRAIEIDQKLKSEKFLKREANLAEANNRLTLQVLDILEKVEEEALTQISKNGSKAKEVVNNGISQITIILIVFFILTVILLYTILTDITKSNQYRKDLELAKDEAEYHGKAKQRFLSNMSHEIRTPLQSIIGYAELLKDEQKNQPKNIEAIYQSSNHLLHIVNEVLDYNRIISGEFSLNPQPFSIKQVLDEVISIILPLAEKKSLHFNYDYDIDENLWITGDAFRLKQILFNLLGNAVKFTLKGKVYFKINSLSKKDEVLFDFIIEDTGIGFSETDKERIFKEFEQINTPERFILNQNGAGLGLSIVKKLVEDQEGRIEVKSKQGEGSTFSIYLKYKVAENQVVPFKKIEALQFKTSDKVWVIDDDLLILDLCKLIFESHQIPFEIFSLAADALKTVPTSDVKFVLIDMRLIDMSGLELCHLLKKRFSKDVKFYAITAQVLPDERESILNNCFDGIIMKPFKSAELLSIFNVNSKSEVFDLDFSNLQKMTFGDNNQLEKILNRFVLNCEEDKELLKNYIQNKDLESSRLIIHRLAGRIAQMGVKELAKSFRLMEIEMAKFDELSILNEEKIKDLLKKLTLLIEQISTKNYSMP